MTNSNVEEAIIEYENDDGRRYVGMRVVMATENDEIVANCIEIIRERGDVFSGNGNGSVSVRVNGDKEHRLELNKIARIILRNNEKV